jgi:hypothetical protein
MEHWTESVKVQLARILALTTAFFGVSENGL